jgi:ABC-type dipeptide/oligopeptide/nickel transport system permease subunit
MSHDHTLPTDLIGTQPRVSEWRRFRKVFFSREVVVFGLIVILAAIITAIFAPVLAPYNPYKQNLRQSLLQPCWEHLLGTDALGRDTLSRIIFGTRTSLMVGIVSIAIAAFIGMTMGLFAGYFGGITNMMIMRFVDSLMSFPIMLLALTIAALLGGGLKNVMIAIGISLTSVYARLMFGQVLSVRENDYILAARSMGASNLHTMIHHVLPNCFPPLIVLITMNMGMAILAEAGLSFLGIGVEPPGAAWGAMVNEGYRYLLKMPILSFAPGLAIMLVVFAFNMVGDGLRDALDPRLRGTL